MPFFFLFIPTLFTFALHPGGHASVLPGLLLCPQHGQGWPVNRQRRCPQPVLPEVALVGLLYFEAPGGLGL